MLLHLVTSHENKNVRKVVIQYMTNMIKANRDLFQGLVVNEELASMHFLTVVHDSSSGKIYPCLTIENNFNITSNALFSLFLFHAAMCGTLC